MSFPGTDDDFPDDAPDDATPDFDSAPDEGGGYDPAVPTDDDVISDPANDPDPAFDPHAGQVALSTINDWLSDLPGGASVDAFPRGAFMQPDNVSLSLGLTPPADPSFASLSAPLSASLPAPSPYGIGDPVSTFASLSVPPTFGAFMQGPAQSDVSFGDGPGLAGDGSAGGIFAPPLQTDQVFEAPAADAAPLAEGIVGEGFGEGENSNDGVEASPDAAAAAPEQAAAPQPAGPLDQTLADIAKSGVSAPAVPDMAEPASGVQLAANGPVTGPTDGSSTAPQGSIRELGKIISGGEGNYNSYNTGTRGGAGHSVINPEPALAVTGQTINQVLSTDGYSASDLSRMHAVGAYQITAQNLADAKAALHLTGDETLTPELQDRIFAEYLLPKLSPALAAYVNKGQGSAADAQYAAAKTWGSIAVPAGYPDRYGNISDGTLTYQRPDVNKANRGSTDALVAYLNSLHK